MPMVRIRRLVYCIILGVSPLATSQNLVLNPSFETYVDCPQTLGNMDNDVMQWRAPTLGSTDYFNTCSAAMGAPKNFNGEQRPDFGNGYVGLYLFAPDDYREYIMGQLVQPLKKGATYKISFHVSLAERSDFAIQTFGVLFSETSFTVETRKALSAMHLTKVGQKSGAVKEIEVADFYSDQEDWVLVETAYEAKGGERFVTIGNFKDNRRTKKMNFRGDLTKGAYYYLDMVQVVAVKDTHHNTILSEPLASVETEEILVPINTTRAFKNVIFAFDAFGLTDGAKKEIQTIYAQMVANPAWHISIDGHTDALGSTDYNQRLSEKRAEAVAQYLMALGLVQERVTWQGHGSTLPLTESPLPAEQGKNRRVEFTMTVAPSTRNRP